MDLTKNEDLSYAASMSSELPENLQLMYKSNTLPNNYMQITQTQGSLFISLVQILKAKRVLDIGSFTGFSAACFAEGLRKVGSTGEVKVTTIESDKQYYEITRKNVNDAGYTDLVEPILGDATAV